ncbi:MAG: FtsH protease activity modulator HflK [Pseudomonadota bacterium]
MSWNNPPGGPWGSGDEPEDLNDYRKKQRRPNAPQNGSDFEDFIRNMQDRLRSIFGGGDGGWNGKTIGLLVLIGFGALVIFQSAFTVAPDQIGIVTRFGAYQAPPRPSGLNFMFWPLDRVQILRVTAENLEEIGYRSAGENSARRDVPDESLMLTADENIVSVGFNVTWAIKTTEPQNFLFNVAAVRDAIRAVAESAMREVVGRNRAEDIITKGQSILQADVVKVMQNTLDSYGAGVQITNVTISRPEVPPPVREAFNEVQQAAQDAQTFQNQAQRDTNQILADARADAVQQIQEAEAYSERVVAEAKGEAARFVSVYNEYRLAKDVTQQRLYLETMERVLSHSDKIILQGGANTQGVVPYLPLPGLKKSGDN